MPIGVGTAMLIGTGISAATSLIGAKMASNASKNAVNAQIAGSDKSIAAMNQARDENIARLRPYMDAGNQAFSRMSDMLGSSNMAPRRPQAPMPPPPQPPGGPGRAPGAGGRIPMAQMMPQATVRMASPNGDEQMDVPANQVSHYRQLGATIIQ